MSSRTAKGIAALAALFAVVAIFCYPFLNLPFGLVKQRLQIAPLALGFGLAWSQRRQSLHIVSHIPRRVAVGSCTRVLAAGPELHASLLISMPLSTPGTLSATVRVLALLRHLRDNLPRIAPFL